MPPLNTHLVIGERVFAQSPHFNTADYGPFLLGCLIVDVNNFTDIDRRTTHFVGRLNDDGVNAYTKSCRNFLAQRDHILKQPWEFLSREEQAFVAGYLCHLAADEPWKESAARLQEQLGLASIKDLPVPADVVLTAFSVLSHAVYRDFPAVIEAVSMTVIPDVFTHIPHSKLLKMWAILENPLKKGHSADSYYEMLRRNGKSEERLLETRARHERFWLDAIALIQTTIGVESFITTAVHRSLAILPQLELGHRSRAKVLQGV